MFLLGLTPVASCSKPAESGKTFTVRGEVVGKPFEGQALRIRHETIPGVMEAMTMDFKLKDPAAGEKILNGDKIRFRYVMNGVDSYIDRIEVLNADTSLDLAGDNEMQEHNAADNGGAK